MVSRKPDVPQSLSKMQVFGITLAMALSMQPAVRDLACVELWAGVQAIASAAKEADMEAVAMDINRLPGITDHAGIHSENILTKDGWKNALFTVLRLRPGGLLWMAPVCSSFVFMNSSNCQRTKKKPAGNTAYGPVKDGNQMALMAAFLYALAMLIGAKPVVEQPAGSMMFRLKPLEKVIEAFKAKSTTCVRCAYTPDEEYGNRFLKRYKFLGESWVKCLHTKCSCPDKKHATMVKVDKAGGVTGNLKALKESQSYPKALGRFVVQTFLEKAMENPPVPVHCSLASSSSSWKRPAAATAAAPVAKRGKSNKLGWKRPLV
eukprot:Skav203281  [mRNA]  locus=scaffold324:220509:221465:+ [translate_table: standard]